MAKGSWQCRNFSSEVKHSKINVKRSFNQPPLNESLPGIPDAVYVSAKTEDNFTVVTKLSNGLRVASENRFGNFSTVGGRYFFF